MANTTAPKSVPMLLKAKDEFILAATKEEIAKNLASKIVRFAFSKELLAFCQKERIECAVEVQSIPQAIFANHYQAAYLIAPKELAAQIQKVADNYLFDTKVLVAIRFEWELEMLAKDGIDGAILPRLP